MKVEVVGKSTVASSAASEPLLCETCWNGLPSGDDEEGEGEGEGEEEELMPATFNGRGIHLVDGYGWVPRKITDPQALGFWLKLERNMGATNAIERFDRAKGRFKAVMMDAAVEMARKDRPSGPICLMLKTDVACPASLTYFSPGVDLSLICQD